MKLKFLSLYPVLSLLYGQFSFAMPDDFCQWNGRVQPKTEVSNEVVYASTLKDDSISEGKFSVSKNQTLTSDGSDGVTKDLKEETDSVDQEASLLGLSRRISNLSFSNDSLSRRESFPSSENSIKKVRILRRVLPSPNSDHNNDVTISENVSILTETPSRYSNIVKWMAKQGINVNVMSSMGWTPMYVAVLYGNKDIVKYLIEHGADVNASTNAGRTPLMAASERGHFEIVKLLVEDGAKIDIQGEDGWTPLMSAAFRGYFSIVEYLVDNGADVSIRAKDGSTAPQLAALRRHWEIVDFLKKHVTLGREIISPLGISLPVADWFQQRHC